MGADAFLSYIRLPSALRHSPSFVQSTHSAGVCCSVFSVLRSVDIRAFRTKKAAGSSIVGEAAALVIVYWESRYVVLGVLCFRRALA